MKFIKNKLLNISNYISKGLQNYLILLKNMMSMSSVRKLRCNGLPHLEFPDEILVYGLRIISKSGETIRINNKNRNILDEILIWFADNGIDSFTYSGERGTIVLKRENIDHIILNKL